MPLSPPAGCLLVGAIGVIVGLAAPSAGASQPDEAAQRRVEYELDRHRTKRDVELFTGSAPDSCAAAIGATELCTWQLSKGRQGWQPIAKAIASTGALNLVCELPLDGGRRSRGSCRAYVRDPRQSAYYLEPEVIVNQVARKRAVKKRKAFEREAVDRAQQDLDDAGRLWDLVDLLGSAPDSCAPAPGRMLRCTWIVDPKHFAHPMLSKWIDDDDTLRLTCDLPADGAVRSHDACAAQPD